MQDFFGNLIVLSVSSALLILISPDGSDVKKYIRYLAGIAVVALVCASFIPLVKSVRDISDGLKDLLLGEGGYNVPGEDGSDWIVGESVKNIEKGIADLVGGRFMIDTTCVGVKAVVNSSDLENIVIEKIIITLSGDGKYVSAEGVKSYIGEMLDCETEVYYAD